MGIWLFMIYYQQVPSFRGNVKLVTVYLEELSNFFA